MEALSNSDHREFPTYPKPPTINTQNKIAISALTWSAMFVSQLKAYLPPISFENPEYVSGQTVGAPLGAGWSLLSGMASVSPPGTGFGGGQALKLVADPQQEPYLTRDLAWNPDEKTAFIDLQLKHAADPENSEATFYVNGAQLAFHILGSHFGVTFWGQVLHRNIILALHSFKL
jgi:hypothetical protein